MGLLTFAINVTLDGCIDHRVGIVDDALLGFFTQLLEGVDAILYGRVAYEMMEDAWPAVARDETAPAAMRDWARTIEGKAKHVMSRTRRDFPWINTTHVEAPLHDAALRLKASCPRGILVGSPGLACALERLGLIDEYRFVVHPVVAGHGPTLFAGLERARLLTLVGTSRLESGVLVTHYRRNAG
jgi:dihydrofolate reductase